VAGRFLAACSSAFARTRAPDSKFRKRRRNCAMQIPMSTLKRY